MKRTIAVVVVLMLFCFDPAYAQWSGSVGADGAWGFNRNNRENADFKLKYTGKKFFVGSDIYVGHNFLQSSKTTTILDAKKEQDEYYKGENKEISPRKLNAGAGIDFGYIFNPYNKLGATLGYGFSGTDEESVQQTERYNNSDKSTLDGTQVDTTYVAGHNITTGISYERLFASRPDARLGISLLGTTKLNSDANRRITSGIFYPKPKNYATFSSLNEFNARLAAVYEDIFHFRKSDLKLRTGLDCISNQDIDGYYAKTLVNGQWRDSTQYKQSYYYDSQTIEPYVNLTYTFGKFDFSVKERVQVYRHYILDKLDERKSPEDLDGLFDKCDAKNLLEAGVSYRIDARHRVMLNYGRTISRPDYKKLCPTLMIGKSDGEYFIGNPELLPETTDKVNLGYSYTKGIFVTKLDFSYRDKKNTAEKVIDLEKSKDITDPGVKTLYTWINNKRQQSLGSRLDLKINGKEIKADIWAGLNFDRYWKNDKTDKEDFNYELGTSVDVFLNETTKLSSSLAYISDRQSAYNYKGEDVIANLRFSKIVIKGMELYLELKDIVDKDIVEETWNEERTYLKITTTTPMSRMVVLGLSYSF